MFINSFRPQQICWKKFQTPAAKLRPLPVIINDSSLRLCSGDLTAPPDPQLARAMTFACRHDIIINTTFKSISYFFFKRLGVYLNVGLLGAASIRRRRFVSKIKTEENEIMCHFRAKRYFLNHFECMKSAINSSSFYTLPIILHL